MLNAAGSATPQGLGTAAAGTSAAYSREDHVHAIPTLSGDVTNTGAAVTVAKIQGAAVSSSTPNSGQVLTWDGTQWAPATNSSGGGGGANGLTYYLNQATAADAPTTGISGTPHQLGRTGEAAQTTLTSGSLTQNVWTLLAGFVSESTPIDPDVTLIPAGLWDFNVWAYGDANVNAGTSIRCRVFKYNGTTLTEITSPSSDQVINGTSAQYSLSVLVPQTDLQLSDRIYVAIEGRATGNNHNVTLQFGDSTPSHVHTSLPLVGGTGLWKSVAGVLQSPASLLVNADVDAAAGIAWSKIEPSYFGSRVKVVGRDAATIQGCIDLCTDADGENPYTVLIPPIAASYSESLTLKGSVSLVGLTAPLNADAVQITGAHTFTPASAQANTNRINFQNLTFISSGTSSNTITCSSSTKYFSKFTFSGCIFSGDKSDTYSHLRTDDNVAVYVDNCRFESSAGGTESSGITHGNGPLYLSNNTTFDVSGRAIDVPVATFPVTRQATVTAGTPGSTTTMTLTSGDTTGLAVGMKISGANLGSTVTIVSLTPPSTVVMSTTPKTSGSFTATFGQTPYVEIHDSVLIGKGAEVVRLGNGLLTGNNSNFTNTASGGSGINMLTGYAAAVGETPAKSTTVGIINSSFTIWDTTAYTITGAVSVVFAALNGISYSNGVPGLSYSTSIGGNVTVYDYSARATSIENGGTGATTRQAALNALAGAVTNLRVLAGDGTNITLRALAAGDIPNLAASKITSGTLAAAQGGTGTTAGITGITTAQLSCLTTAATANLVPQLSATGFLSTAQLATISSLPTAAIGSLSYIPTITVDTKGRVTALTSAALTNLTSAQLGCLTTAATANLVPQLTTAGFLSTTQLATVSGLPVTAIGSSTIVPTITVDTKGRVTVLATTALSGLTTAQLGCLTTAATANLVPQLTTSGLLSLTQMPTLNQNTTGTAANVTGVVAIANGGTGATSQLAALTSLGAVATSQLTTAATASGVPQLTTSGLLSLTQMPTIPVANGGTGAATLTGLVKGNGTSAMTAAAAADVATTLGSQTAAYVYAAPAAAAGTPVFRALVSGDIPTLNQNTTGTASKATNVVGGVLGSTQYQSAADTTATLAPNTTATKKFLRQTGTGTVGAAPAWDTVIAGDITNGQIAIANGGTGASTAQTGLNALAGGATPITAGSGKALISNGTNVSFGQLDLAAATGITGILQPENGGYGFAFGNMEGLRNIAGYNLITGGTSFPISTTDGHIMWVNGTGATTVTIFDLTVAGRIYLKFRIINKSTGTLTVKLFGGTTLCTIATLNSREFITGIHETNTADNVAFLPSQTTTV